MSTYGWTVDQVNDLTVPQMMTLIEEIKAVHATPDKPGAAGSGDQDGALEALSHHVVDEVPDAAPAATSRTGSRIKLFDPKSGRRVL